MTRSRDEIELDLPFAVNGTLAPDEMDEVEAWLDSDELLRAEYEALAAIRARMQAEEVRSPGEFGLARLMRDIDRDAAATPATATPAAAPAPAGSAPAPAGNRTWLWQLAAALAVLAFLTQSLLLRGGETTGGPGGYELAGAGSVPRADLIVSFAPDATEAQIRALLLGLDTEIVAGPSALGLYQLDVLEPGAEDRVAQALQGATDIIESVEDAGN